MAKKDRLTPTQVDAARLKIIDSTIDKMMNERHAPVLKSAIKKTLKLTGREAVTLANYIDNQIQLPLGDTHD